MGIGTFFDMLTMVSLVALIIGLAAGGTMSADQAAGALVILAVLVAISRAARMSVPRLVFRIALPILAVWALLFKYGGLDPRANAQILSSLGTIVVLLFAVYVMVYMPFRRHR
jgi:hypothetical protein